MLLIKRVGRQYVESRRIVGGLHVRQALTRWPGQARGGGGDRSSPASSHGPGRAPGMVQSSSTCRPRLLGDHTTEVAFHPVTDLSCRPAGVSPSTARIGSLCAAFRYDTFIQRYRFVYDYNTLPGYLQFPDIVLYKIIRKEYSSDSALTKVHVHLLRWSAL